MNVKSRKKFAGSRELAWGPHAHRSVVPRRNHEEVESRDMAWRPGPGGTIVPCPFLLRLNSFFHFWEDYLVAF